MRRSLASVPFAVALLIAAPVAQAQTDTDRATARELGMEGQAALEKKDFKTAEDRFKRADALFHAPTLLLGYARAEAGLGKVVNASESYSRIVREGVAPGAPKVFADAVEAARAEVGAVQARIANVTITVTGPESPRVTLDDLVVPTAALGVRRPVDPGVHVVKATSDGWEPAETKFTVAEAAAATAALTLKKSATPAVAATSLPSPSPSQPPPDGSTTPASDTMPASGGGSSQRTIGFVALGVGGAALATGAITGLLALGKHSDLQNQCPNSSCPSSVQSDVDSYHSMGTLSTVAFIAGGVLAGAGTVLIFTAPRGQPAAPTTGASVTPFIGLGTVGAVGRF